MMSDVICDSDLRVNAAYVTEYVSAQQSWISNGGPSAGDCQYYEGSTAPIYVLHHGEDMKVSDGKSSSTSSLFL